MSLEPAFREEDADLGLAWASSFEEDWHGPGVAFVGRGGPE